MMAVGKIAPKLLGQLIFVDKVVQFNDICQNYNPELEVFSE